MGECFFRYRLTRVVSEKGPLNGCYLITDCHVFANCVLMPHVTKTILFYTVSAINNNKCIQQNINTETKTKYSSGYGVDISYLHKTICKICPVFNVMSDVL